MVKSSKSVPLISETQQIINIIFQTLRIYGYKGVWEDESRKKTLAHWEKLVKAAGSWVKVAKYKLAAYVAYSLKQESLPKAPFSDELGDLPGKLLCGRPDRYMRLLTDESKRTKEQIYSFLTTVNKGIKKGAPRVSKETLKAAERDLIDSLTTPHEPLGTTLLPVSWADLSEHFHDMPDLAVSRFSIEKQLRRTVREIFQGKKYTFKDRAKAFVPSSSANYYRSRNGAGAIGYLLEREDLFQGLRKPGGYVKAKEEEVNEDEGMSEELKEIEVTGEGELDAAFQTFWTRMLEEAVHFEENLVEPVALAEALKPRVITKHPPIRGTVLKSLQKFMHTTLKQHPAFELIGRPIDAKYIRDRLGATLKPEELFLSGDYASATDNLRSFVSEVIADEIAVVIGLTEYERKLFIESLTRHTFEGGRKQKRGQLMGSITSFPVLCIANAAMCRWALELAKNVNLTLRNAPLGINGDDCIMKTTRLGYKLWQMITRAAGLEESVGKTILHREWVEMNSTTFFFDPENPTEEEETSFFQGSWRTSLRKNPYRLIKFINFGLIFGLKRSDAGNNEEAFLGNVGVRYRELLKMSPEWAHEVLHDQFVESNQVYLGKEKGRYLNCPWYIPEWLGGVGMTGLKQPSELDLRIANMIRRNWDKKQPKKISEGPKNWRTWIVAQSKLPKPFIVEEEDEGVETYKNLVGKICINLLFDSTVDLKTLYDSEMDIQSARWKVRYNSKLWTPSTYKRLGEPMKVEELAYIKRYESVRPNTPKIIVDLD